MSDFLNDNLGLIFAFSDQRVFGPWSIILTVTAVMKGGTQLVEGGRLTGADTRFCRESSKSRGVLGVKS